MEAAVAFDTHQFVKNLTANGFTEKQAEVLVSQQVAMLNSNLATKADIQSVNERIEALRSDTERYIAELRSDTEKLRSDTAARIAELKADLQRWIITVIATLAGILVAVGGLVVALVRLL